MRRFPLIFLAFSLVLPSCTRPPSTSTAGLQLVATTSIIADVVQAVAGPGVAVQALLPVGVDPHSFQPTPRDVARVAAASLVFMNGLGLEDFMRPLLQNAGGNAKIIVLSEHLPLPEGQGEEIDPHLWLDPRNVEAWLERIEAALSELDPLNAAAYRANAQAYRQSLVELDRWIQEQVAQIPLENRQLVSQHQVLGHFALRYGFTQVGAVLPGFSTLAQPSARELATLQDAIRQLGVKAIFVESAVNPDLAQRLAQDTGTAVVLIYTDSLSPSGGPASTYLEMMRFDVTEIVNALR